ncbi:plasmid pRiA4b ORF-3 family protein [Roseovarius sp. CAU 1744]|uniref:plasmid pRiA4b ORF-3 family protein n=1 Tax=Roseovarius sp. CAU 1744 TaxID=3140368 RepID=UPI00325B0BC8
MSILEIEIKLDEIEFDISRRLQVPAYIRLDQLHLALQAAMGWKNIHSYSFEANGIIWGLPDPDFGYGDLPPSNITLIEVIEKTGVKSLCYLYDFGDQWEHTLLIGNSSDPKPGLLYPRLTYLNGRCPPENVGGVPGYENLLQDISDPNHPEFSRFNDLLGEEFDPGIADIDARNFAVLKLAKSWNIMSNQRPDYMQDELILKNE